MVTAKQYVKKRLDRQESLGKLVNRLGKRIVEVEFMFASAYHNAMCDECPYNPKNPKNMKKPK